MSRSSASRGSSWLEALREFSAFRKQLQDPSLTVSAASSVAAPTTVTPYPDSKNRRHIYELVAQAQLFGAPGYRVSAENLRVLRAARWELLRVGSPRNKSLLVERILQLYTEASRQLFYDAVPSQAERQSLLLEQMQCLVEARVTGIELNARHYRHPLQAPQLSEIGADLPLVLLKELEMSERQQKRTPQSKNRRAVPPSDVRRSADPRMQAGQTASTGAAEAAQRTEAEDTENRELVAARLDCAVGLASSGYVDAALGLCTGEGFPYVVRQVAQMRRDGWKQAWALADAVPLHLLIPDPRVLRRTSADDGVAETQAEEVCHPGWLNGVLDAAKRRYRATDDPAVHEWVHSFMRVWMEGGGVASGHGGPRAVSFAGKGRQAPSDRPESLHAIPVPVKVMETFLGVCPASAWREALSMVMCYNTSGFPFPTSEHTQHALAKSPAAGSGAPKDQEERSLSSSQRREDGERGNEGSATRPGTEEKVAMGRLMTLLHVAQQPEEILRLFYGSFFSAEALVQAEAMRQQDKTAMGDDGADGPVWCPSDDFLSAADVQHPATYNHAMMALCELGLWRRAMLFYEQLPGDFANRYTHWTAARMFLRPSRSARASSAASGLAPGNDTSDGKEVVPVFMAEAAEEVFQFCLTALRRACGDSTSSDTSVHSPFMAGSRGESEKTDEQGEGSTAHKAAQQMPVSFPDDDAVFENLALWAAARQDWQAMLWLVKHAPHHRCRYIRLIALATFYRALEKDTQHGTVKAIPQETLRQYSSFRKGDAQQEGRRGKRPSSTPRLESAGKAKGEKDAAAASKNTAHGLVKESLSNATTTASAREAALHREAARQLHKLLSSSDATVKQICLALAFIANSSTAVSLYAPSQPAPTPRGVCEASESTPKGGSERDAEPSVDAVLCSEVVNAFVHSLGHHVNHSQDSLDHVIATFMNQFFSLRRRQKGRAEERSSAAAAVVNPTPSATPCFPSFQRKNVLTEVMHLAEGLNGNLDEGWRVVLQVFSQLGERQGLSIARAAPAMVSAGMRPEVAVKFLDV